MKLTSELLELLHLNSSLKELLGYMKSIETSMVQQGIPSSTPQIIRVLPHDRDAFTQGLTYHKGILFESTGLTGRSSLRQINPQDGTVLKVIPLKVHFGEGIAVLENRLYQLTWKSRRALIYDLTTLDTVGEVILKGEGWGLATGPGFLIMSDGSSILRFRDRDFSVLRRLRVKSNWIPIRRINDLEYARGKIYANILESSKIFEISLDTGKLHRIIDCSSLMLMEEPKDPVQVLNGIAFNPDSDSFFLTGKYWKHLFEVKLPP